MFKFFKRNKKSTVQKYRIYTESKTGRVEWHEFTFSKPLFAELQFSEMCRSPKSYKCVALYKMEGYESVLLETWRGWK